MTRNQHYGLACRGFLVSGSPSRNYNPRLLPDMRLAIGIVFVELQSTLIPDGKSRLLAKVAISADTAKCLFGKKCRPLPHPWPYRFAKRPISPCETARIAVRNGPFRKVKWAVLQRIVAQCVTGYGKRACAEGHAAPRETSVRGLPTGPAAVARAVGRNSKKGVFALPIAQIVLYLQIICGLHCGGLHP